MILHQRYSTQRRAMYNSHSHHAHKFCYRNAIEHVHHGNVSCFKRNKFSIYSLETQTQNSLNKCHANNSTTKSVLIPADSLNQCSSETMQTMSHLETVKQNMQQITHARTPASCQADALSAVQTTPDSATAPKNPTRCRQAKCNTKNRVSGNSNAHSSLHRLSSRAAAIAHSAIRYRHSSYIGTSRTLGGSLAFIKIKSWSRP